MTRLAVFIFIVLFSGASRADWPSCLNKSEFTEKKLEFAKNFKIWIHKDGYLLSSIRPGEQKANYYYLTRKKKKISCLESIDIPIKKTVLLSSTYIEYLNEINAKKAIKAVASALKIKRNDFLELGGNPSIERIWKLNPDIIFGYYFSNIDKKKFQNFENKKLKYALVWDYLEESPLGRSEWLIFYGAFFDEINLSRKVFSTIKNNYRKLRDKAKSNIKKKTNVLLGEVYQDKWYSPGGRSVMAQFINDAGANYIFSTNKDNKPIILSLESFSKKSKIKKIDFWILNNLWKTKKDIVKTERRLGSIIDLDSVLIFNSKNPNFFWDKMYPRVDLYLKDLIEVFSKNKNTKLTWMRKVND